MINKTDFELKNVKYFNGTDGLCFSMTVYIKGKKAFNAQNDGRGGDNLYTPVDFVEGKALLKEAHEFVKTLPPYKFENWGNEIPYDLDILLEDLFIEKQERDFFKKKCKKSTIFKLPNDKNGEYHEVKRLYNDGIKMYIMGKYPEAVIINEQFAERK